MAIVPNLELSVLILVLGSDEVLWRVVAELHKLAVEASIAMRTMPAILMPPECDEWRNLGETMQPPSVTT